MNVVSTLNEKLLQQPFSSNQTENSDILSAYQNIASGYAKNENLIAVLSDLKSNRSYIYNGGIGEKLGISKRDSQKALDSIWEEDILDRIHPDDLIMKHLLELRFFHFLKKLPIEERSDFCVVSKMRMRNQSDEYIFVQHRMFYVSDSPFGNFELALCLYGYPYERNTSIPVGWIMNSVTGEIINSEKKESEDILSRREVEILQLIDRGELSKNIADQLSISINTVNRHRQNILEKLRVKNSIEACRMAKLMNLF